MTVIHNVFTDLVETPTAGGRSRENKGRGVKILINSAHLCKSRMNITAQVMFAVLPVTMLPLPADFGVSRFSCSLTGSTPEINPNMDIAPSAHWLQTDCSKSCKRNQTRIVQRNTSHKSLLSYEHTRPVQRCCVQRNLQLRMLGMQLHQGHAEGTFELSRFLLPWHWWEYWHVVPHCCCGKSSNVHNWGIVG